MSVYKIHKHKFQSYILQCIKRAPIACCICSRVFDVMQHLYIIIFWGHAHGTGGPPVATMHNLEGLSVAAVHGPEGQVTARTTYYVTVTLCLRQKNRTVHSTDVRHQGNLLLTES